MSDKRIIGAGGRSRSSSSRTPVEDPDSLQSHQYGQIIDLVSEGPIKGLVNGLHSVYLDDTPVLGPEGNPNFSGFTLVERLGTNDQSPVDGFSAVENEIAVGVEVTHGSPIVRTVSGDVDAAVVTVGIPQLTQTDVSTGDLHGTTVQLGIEVQNNGGGFKAVPVDSAWSAMSSNGVSGQTVALDNVYGIGIKFSVTGGITSITYTSASDGGVDNPDGVGDGLSGTDGVGPNGADGSMDGSIGDSGLA